MKTQVIVTLKSQYHLDDLLAAARLARSTFFYHQKRLNNPDKHKRLKQAICEIFTRMYRRYGYRRIHAQLRYEGWNVNHKLVYKLMKQLGLKSKVRNKKKYNSYKPPSHAHHIASNVLNRQFKPEKPNKVWVSDVTEFRINHKKVYLSPIMDLCDRGILSYNLSTSPTTAFTAKSLRDAIKEHTPGKGLIIHTDQGFQYQHASWRTLIKTINGTQSMSRKGNCYDNSIIENFFSHLKTEMYHGESFRDLKDFYQAINTYINWYNTQRLQSHCNGLTPKQYRHQTLTM